MRDIELLKMAAKAAGYSVQLMSDPVESGEQCSTFIHVQGQYWNPLMRDEDAAKLAADLNFTVRWEGGPLTVCVTMPSGDQQWYEAHGNDRRRGLREAIVWAAADIGKTMTGRLQLDTTALTGHTKL